jgi:formamidopyrimidine-DNA glycosylase
VPELPEVETIKNELMPHIIGRKLTGVTLFWDGIVRQPSVTDFRSRLIGQKITGLARHGKYLIAGLSSDDLLIIHLKMSGSLLISQDSSEPPKYTRAIIHLDKGTNIFFRDPRKFGAMWLVGDKDTIVGNEALFAARIHPLRPGGSLSQDEIERLHSAIKQVLWSAIGNKGASVVNYYRPSGELGTAHFEFKVAHGRGKDCPNCSTPIQRITVRNRGTYFCPKCQPEL